MILAAVQQAGVTYEEAYRLAGIGDRAVDRWKARAAQVADLLPEQWNRMLKAELRRIGADLGLEESDIRGSGAVVGGSRTVTREDWVDAIQEYAGKFLDFVERLARANLEGEMATVSKLREIAQGGRFEVRNGERTWVPRVRSKTIEKFDPATGKVIERAVEVTDVGPSEKSLMFILERRYGRWTPRRAIDTAQTSDDPRDIARQVAAALREMESSVPGEPGA